MSVISGFNILGRDLASYPQGSKAFCSGGEYWVKVSSGWKCCVTGVISSKPGGYLTYIDTPTKVANHASKTENIRIRK